MDIDILRIVIEVAHRGSFAAVARERDLDPSSISRIIAALEAELGIRLFQRTTRSMTLTEAGDLYLKRVEALVDEFDQAREAALALKSHPMDTLRLTTAGMGPALLANWLIDAEIQAGHLIDLFPAYRITATDFETAAWILYPSRTFLPNKVRIMINFLQQTLSRSE